MNRTLRVDLVKKEKMQRNETDEPETGFEEKANIISNHIEESVMKIGVIVGAYVLLDTFRKVAIALASK